MDAAVLMTRRGIAHLCVVENGLLVGVISERDLFALQRVGIVQLSRSLQTAPDVPALATAAAHVHVLADRMLAQGLSASPLIQIVTALNDHTARRAIELVLAQAGTGLPRFAWIAFGSEGRQEQTLKTDQDNGIVFEAAPGAATEAARAALLPLAERINAVLAQCGFPLCAGNIMASNPECCLSEAEWQRRFAAWIDQGNPESLLRASIFFDLRPLYGEAALADALREWLCRAVPENPRFLHQMTENALQNHPPLGLVGNLVLESGGDHPGTVNLKLHGTSPFVDGARIFALRQGLPETNTQARLLAAGNSGTVPAEEARSWSESFAFILLLRMRQQNMQAAKGLRPHNHVDPDALSDLERRILKEALRQARKLQRRLALDYAL
jgi:CBS domain-containing protein